MITIKDIEKIIKDAKDMKFEASVRDISYVILFFEYCNAAIAYKSIFNKDANDKEIEKYDKSKLVNFLKTYIASNFSSKEEKPINTETILADISFEENKSALVSLLSEIQVAIDKGEISYKDGIKIQADIRTKLNDKFEVEKKEGQQYVIVETKYNNICEYCHHEIYIPTKEVLMKEYNLIENTK